MIAKTISEFIECDMEEIVEKDKRKGIIGYIKSGYQASRGKIDHIEDSKYELSDYDLLIIGTPVWAGKMSIPVRTYLNKNKNKIPLLACFCTAGRSGIENTIEDMGNYVNITPLASFGVKSSDIKDGTYKNIIEKFALEVI
jgi:flavodoxin